ncbi:MAG TPA: hypothetical protein PLE69_02400 [bacterium]|nr:hypothetical protein [bacterium]
MMPCFATYISKDKPILIHRYSREDYSDGYDDFVDIFSYDNGRTWTEPVPLGCDKGEPIESSSTGSILFSSIKDGKVYWIGNLCIDGVRANGNWPRTPLIIAEIDEENFVIKRDSIRVIDRRQPGEPPELQLSNFRIYQDRENGDIVLFLTRYAERGHENNRWMLADYYRYRIKIKNG